MPYKIYFIANPYDTDHNARRVRRATQEATLNVVREADQHHVAACSATASEPDVVVDRQARVVTALEQVSC